MMYALLSSFVLLAAAPDTFRHWAVEAVVVEAWPASVGQMLSAAELAELPRSAPRLPFEEPRLGLRDPSRGLWVGSQHGLMYLPAGAPRWRVFHSRRWLPSDDVQALSLKEDGSLLVKTSAGTVRFFEREQSLVQKMLEIDDTLQKHHIRDGLVGSIRLHEPGKLEAGHRQGSNDNDGLWTSLYIAAEAFRYATTKEPAARQNARKALEALMFLERITGIPGFAARSVVPIEDDPAKYRGEWHRSADNRWWWKGDTSSDEVDGHYFAYAIYYDLAADEAEKQEIRQYVARITDHILDHGLYYVGPPGVPTLWGVWAPEKLNHDLRRAGDRGLNSLEILSHLKVADHIVGKPRYAEAAKELIERHSYHINTVFQKRAWPPEWVNHSDDELAFLAYYPLLIYERDPELRKIYLSSLSITWRSERAEQSPFFNLIYGACLQANTWTDPGKRPDVAGVAPEDYDRDVCLAWFRDVPQDTIHWEVNNSHRRDVGNVVRNRFRRACGDVLLPPSERHVMRWNGDPFVLDGGSEGRSRDDGTAIILPYWMGRYHRLID